MVNGWQHWSDVEIEVLLDIGKMNRFRCSLMECTAIAPYCSEARAKCALGRGLGFPPEMC